MPRRDMYLIVTARETFSCDSDACIGRPSSGVRPSGQWRALALVRRCNFGVLEVIPFAEWPTALPDLQWTFKNGKPRYTLRDLDHGTVREWGSMVQRVYVN